MRASRLRKYVTPDAHTSCVPMGATTSGMGDPSLNGSSNKLSVWVMSHSCKSSRFTTVSQSLS